MRGSGVQSAALQGGGAARPARFFSLQQQALGLVVLLGVVAVAAALGVMVSRSAAPASTSNNNGQLSEAASSAAPSAMPISNAPSVPATPVPSTWPTTSASPTSHAPTKPITLSPTSSLSPTTSGQPTALPTSASPVTQSPVPPVTHSPSTTFSPSTSSSPVSTSSPSTHRPAAQPTSQPTSPTIGILGTCTGLPCSPTAYCRSSAGYCGATSPWCSPTSTWSQGCLSLTHSPTVPTSSPTSRPTPPTVPSTSAPSSTTSPGYHQEIGTYFVQWGIYSEQFFVKDLLPQMPYLTYINYAFVNLYPQSDGTYQCESNVIKTESGNGDGGDAYADYLVRFTAAQSVDGVADVYHQSLAGNFNQLVKLKALYPNVKIMLSIGGWTWSKWFSYAASTAANRTATVSSCINQYIKGNLTAESGYPYSGSSGAAYGIFDGIDIDWEYPGKQGFGYNTVSPQDGANHVLLLKEFRDQLDAFGAQVGRKLYLSTAIGIANSSIDETQVANYMQHVDWVDMMTYDYNGAWSANGPTDFQSNLFADPNGPNYATQSDFCGSCAVANLISRGATPSKLRLGVPFYGRGWTGVPSTNNGLYQSATGGASGATQVGIQNYNLLYNTGASAYFDSVTQQSWTYDGTNFWSFDTPAVVTLKASWAKSMGLGGVFAWSADGDANAVLTKAMVAP